MHDKKYETYWSTVINYPEMFQKYIKTITILQRTRSPVSPQLKDNLETNVDIKPIMVVKLTSQHHFQSINNGILSRLIDKRELNPRSDLNK